MENILITKERMCNICDSCKDCWNRTLSEVEKENKAE